MITKRQKQILDFVSIYNDKKGYSPSLKEIKKHFRLSSESTVHQHIKSLETKGYLKKEKNQPRAINVKQELGMIEIPLLGNIAAGQPIEVIQNKEIIAIPKSKLPHSGEFYALRVVGDSMIDENINDGDLVLVKQQNTAKNGQKVVALVDDYKAT
ncbi:MAG: repressor LexA, partial [Candidatus Pacebacteria bacterium]|nr:repressor LexA [Candidatus Paceibacterota bacterium]